MNDTTTVTTLLRGLPRRPTGIYVLYGEEAQLIEEARTAIRAAAKPERRERADLEKLADSPIIKNRGGSLFGSGACLYEVIGHGTPPQSAVAAMKKLTARLEPPDVLIVSIYGLAYKQHKAAWLRDISAGGRAAVAARLTAAATADWCRRWLAEWKMTVADDSINWLAAQTEGNLAAAKQCLYKLQLTGNHDKADCAAQVAAALSGDARYNVFDLSEAALAGNGKQSLAILNVLWDIQEPPPLIVWAIANTAGGILAAKRGEAPGWGLPAAKIREVASHTTEQAIIRVLRRAAHADRVIKGIDIGDIKIALIDAVAGLACLRRGVKMSTPLLQTS